MEIGILAAFWMVSFALVMTPGADWAYAISAGLRGRAIAPAVGGMLLGYLMITLVVAAGLGALVAQMPRILDVLTIVGAAYLLWLGAGVLIRPPVPKEGAQHESTWLGWVFRGFGISGLNPKALLLFLALLPQFTSKSALWSVFSQITVLGAIQIVNCALVYTLVGIAAKFVLRARPLAARRVSQFSGVAMIAVALMILVERFATQ
jgi:threonine/homoserine/homoserine lactone efflux protein